jgi:multidrug efflux pump subunit AcrA (membrane-fusion protein)
MLNLSDVSVNEKIRMERYRAFSSIINIRPAGLLARAMVITLVVTVLFLFLPWTQNIQSEGIVTTLYPSERPQTLQSIIPGAIQKWYVREGDVVKKGDTILVLSEIKDEYFDPLLLDRMQSQITAKQQSLRAYNDKISALDQQLLALNKGLQVKLSQARMKVEQAQFKIKADSAQFLAAQAEYDVAEFQYRRMDTLFKQGLRSLTDLESRNIKMQETRAKLQTAQNRLLASRAELSVANQELDALTQEYADKQSKALSERSQAASELFKTEAEVAKMQNMLSNYTIRSGYYFITAPQDGIITQTIKAGIGEMVSTGEELLSIMPAQIHLATEVYVRPLDVSLLTPGVKVRLQFDGWPAVVFSGWPGTSFGTFGGVVAAIDQFPSENGMFRVLVKPDPEDTPWPYLLKVGGGCKSIMLLNDVPLWYELWRQINGFPPDFYQRHPKLNNQPTDAAKKDKPAKK